MADPARKHSRNASGPWFVDDTCIDCGVCREHAPGVFDDAGDASFVAREPANPDEIRRAWLSLLACPTRSIGSSGVPRPADAVFPLRIDGDVSLCGYTSRETFGGQAYFVRRQDGHGNLLVDSPRPVEALLHSLESQGGVADILLTHRDDVAHAGETGARFGSRIWIHEDDADSAPFATHFIRGTQAIELHRGVLAIPIPGHTRGSVAFLVDGTYLFSGDSLAWDREAEDLEAFRDYTWYSWEAQARSLERLATHSFTWVLPGHGDRTPHAMPDLPARLRALARRMRR
ncbi:MAG: MBL fold metallo-hydrolase [Planctomycetes bacterium]|nr:MBL fold metallo-hydrolase [Planctomycetota bacterium]MBI3846407.1 MBL fold metallo-hydrolase [Planctomycetota bacterium]